MRSVRSNILVGTWSVGFTLATKWSRGRLVFRSGPLRRPWRGSYGQSGRPVSPTAIPRLAPNGYDVRVSAATGDFDSERKRENIRSGHSRRNDRRSYVLDMGRLGQLNHDPERSIGNRIVSPFVTGDVLV